MSEQKVQLPPAPGTAGWLVMLAGRLIGLVMAALLLRLAIELLGVYLWWSQEGTKHLFLVVSKEQADLLLRIQQHPYGNKIQALLNMCRTSILVMRQWVDIRYFSVSLNTVAYTLLSFLLRLLWLVTMLPLLGLCLFTGLVEGLVQRDLRRFGTGLESTFIYRYARRIGGSVSGTGLIFWLAQPFCLPPLMILLPAAIWTGIAVWVVACSFKRWL